MIDERLLKNEEKAVFCLRSLYGKYGYSPFKMSKFEEYELYVKNKEFLVSDRAITFNDTNGQLLALKPDVTLSIIKSARDIPGEKQKVYYNENVYRVSESTHRYKEIMQAGLECIGDIDLYDIYEVVSLAAQSLAAIGDEFVLEISNLGLLSGILERTCSSRAFCEKAIDFIKEKNSHDFLRLCNEYGIEKEKAEILTVFVSAYGERKKVISELEKVCSKEELSPLSKLSDLLDSSPFSERIVFDFSVVNNMNYYNGFVFRGFLNGVSERLLAGGQYDKMMKKMGKRSGAIGFAIYLDILEQLQNENEKTDVDVLLIYDNDTKPREVAKKVSELISCGFTVSAQKTDSGKIKAKKVIDLRKEKNNA